MAITHLHLTLEHDHNAIITELRSSGIDGKGQNEVFHTLDALKVWKDWVDSNYGPLTSIDHHSNPDDPPDMQLHFVKGHVPLEHTELKPHPFGMVDAIHHRDCPDQFVTVPSLSKKPKTRRDIIDAMSSLDADAWADSADERKEWLCEFKTHVRRKMRKQKTGLLLVQDTALRMPSDVRELAISFQQEVQLPAMSDLGQLIILLHSRLNSVQHVSFLFQRGTDLQERSKLR